MDFPRFVFTSPGPLPCGNGRNYGEKLVNDEYELAAALEAGFYASLPEALDPPAKPEPVAAPELPAAEPAPEEPAEAPARRRGRPRAEEA